MGTWIGSKSSALAYLQRHQATFILSQTASKESIAGLTSRTETKTKFIQPYSYFYIPHMINIYSSIFLGTWENKPSSPTFYWNYVLSPQFKSFGALQTVKSNIISLCMIFKSTSKDSKVSPLAEIKGCPLAKVHCKYIRCKKYTFYVRLESPCTSAVSFTPE